MATPVSICSAALVMLGDKPIASLTESTDRARSVANVYPTERLAFLRAHPGIARSSARTLRPTRPLRSSTLMPASSCLQTACAF